LNYLQHGRLTLPAIAFADAVRFFLTTTKKFSFSREELLSCAAGFDLFRAHYPEIQIRMLSRLGNLLGRKAAPAASQAVRPSLPQSGSASQSQRRQDPRDTYARVFRWKPAAEFARPTRVEIVGSFTRWQTVTLTHDAVQNAWTITIDGIAGKKTHHYMLLIDGKPVFDPACDGFACPQGFDEEQFALETEKGPRVLMLFSQTK
jgi:hypothetical protein